MALTRKFVPSEAVYQDHDRVVFKTKAGGFFEKLTVRGKSKKFCEELHEHANVRTGEALTPRQMAFRAGYMESRKDSANAWKSNQRKLGNDSQKMLVDRRVLFLKQPN